MLYVLSGIGGSILSTLFIRKTISVGASGALFGLLGATLSELLTNWSIYANKVHLTKLFTYNIYNKIKYNLRLVSRDHFFIFSVCCIIDSHLDHPH